MFRCLRSGRSRLSVSAVSAMALAAGAPSLAQACSSCGCSVGTDWSDIGLASATGLRLDLRYDFVYQNQLRKGRSPTSPDPLNPPGDVGEIQQGTLTNFYTVTADYAFGRNWGLNLQLPYLIRLHQTLPLDDSNSTQIDTSDYRGIGDLRIVGRYQGFFSDHSLGVQFGLKLPTGS